MYPNDNVHYAQQRLNGTIIRHDDKAVLVDAVTYAGAEEPLQITATELISGNIICESIDKFNMVPVSLGYVNHKGRVGTNCYYLTRIPLRADWRQGFRKTQAFCATGDYRWNSKDIAETIEGHFPTLDKSLEVVADGHSQIAWCRDFSVDSERSIFYRGYGKVGNFIKDAKDYLLDNRFGWVEESLKEVV